MKNFIFKYYGFLGLALGGMSLWLISQYGGDNQIELYGAVAAGTLGFFYFIQQQKLAETQLFYNLFIMFNSRYDNLNEKLSSIVKCPAEELTTDHQNTLIDYFNLCAEEYLFYKEGYIHPDAWRSWCRGMRWYLSHKHIRDIWDKEIKTNSYYGLSLPVIEKGAT
ncbi:hypothetical protein WCX72_06860 [Sulfurimonas sp. HSL1-6]|uniref:hypothetical protein n=1 Tax=Thiomicrolovo immobilis TaxID=3131935 RepID=UPI0031FA34AE